MTTRDCSNFATPECFDEERANHPGVHPALSEDGTKTGSRGASNRTVYAICDGVVELVQKEGGLDSCVKIHHPDRDVEDIMAYYGHVFPREGLDTVKADDPIGVMDVWGGTSHLQRS
jgi:hypothetical protein